MGWCAPSVSNPLLSSHIAVATTLASRPRQQAGS
jgi:hypothetical protein